MTAASAATSCTLSSNGALSCTTSLTTGSDSLTYHAVDNLGGQSSPATVTLNVNIPPTAVDDTATTDEDTFVDIDVSANDTDPETANPGLTATNITNVTNGTAVLQAGNRIVRFTPAANLNSTTNPGASAFSFQYKANDGTSDSTSAATVTITVNAVNDAPVLAPDTGAAPDYTENAPAVAIAGASLTLTDVDTTTSTSGTVQITTGFQSGADVLSFTPIGGNPVTGSFIGATMT